MKDKGKLKHHLPSFFPTRLSFTVSFLIPLPLSRAVKVDGEWGHSSSVPFLPSHIFPLLQCGPSIGHSSFRTYSPDQTWSSPWAAVWIFALTLTSALTLGFSGQVFTFFFPHSTLPSSVFHFLKYTFPQRHHHLGCGAQPCLGLSSQRPPCSSHYPPLGTCTP